MGAITNLLLTRVRPATDLPCAVRARRGTSPRLAAARALLERPLVVGASVSADYFTLNPVARLRESFGLKTRAPGHARHGATARRLLPKLGLFDYRAATAVIGLDLFFWDSVWPSYAESARALERLCEQTGRVATPLVLGTVPRLSFGFLQPGRARLNAAIRRAAATYSHVRLVDLDSIYLELQARKGFRLRGRPYPLATLAPDGLHLSAPACEFLAGHLLAALTAAPALRAAS